MIKSNRLSKIPYRTGENFRYDTELISKKGAKKILDAKGQKNYSCKFGSRLG
jgi:hypothetical protein